jgi:hypothetical protein
MKNLLALLLFIGLIGFMIHLVTDASNQPLAPAPLTEQKASAPADKEPAPPAREIIAGQLVPSKEIAPDAGIRVGHSTLTIKNQDAADWPSINVFINSDPPYGFGLQIRPLKAGAETQLQLDQFCKPDGLRFDPFHYAVRKVCIGGNGFGYQAFGF